MAERLAINPAKVDWSGENPGIYLKETQDGPFLNLSLFFRVVLSPHGRGTAMLVLGEPETGRGWPDAPNVIVTDNPALGRYLIDGFVVNMPTFRGKAGLKAATFLPLAHAASEGTTTTAWRETVVGGGVAAEMSWEKLGEPFAVDVTKDKSATGTHEMYSIFVEARTASVTLNGRRLPGAAAQRTLFGRTISTAFLAFSETWLTPP